MFEIGHSLRSARERQGLGYPEVELATKIRAKYIRALEEEDFDALPGDTYVRGFLRAYADYLGLDGEIYVEEYASRFHLNDYWAEEPAPPPRRPRRTRRERTIERRAVVLALVGIAVLTALVFAAWQYGGATTNVPALHDDGPRADLILRGVGKGTYLVVRKTSKTGQLLFRGTLTSGRSEDFSGKLFYVFARSEAGVRITRQAHGVTLIDRGLILHARKNSSSG